MVENFLLLDTSLFQYFSLDTSLLILLPWYFAHKFSESQRINFIPRQQLHWTIIWNSAEFLEEKKLVHPKNFKKDMYVFLCGLLSFFLRVFSLFYSSFFSFFLEFSPIEKSSQGWNLLEFNACIIFERIVMNWNFSEIHQEREREREERKWQKKFREEKKSEKRKRGRKRGFSWYLPSGSMIFPVARYSQTCFLPCFLVSLASLPVKIVMTMTITKPGFPGWGKV